MSNIECTDVRVIFLKVKYGNLTKKNNTAQNMAYMLGGCQGERCQKQVTDEAATVNGETVMATDDSLETHMPSSSLTMTLKPTSTVEPSQDQYRPAA